MPSPNNADPPIILIVSNMDDWSVRDCLSALTDAGAQVETVPDVYAAMARLALGPMVSEILLDARTLDDQEMSFLRVAPRYHPSVKVLVPSFDGTAERVAAYGAGLRAVDVASIVASLAAQCAPAATGADQPPTTALSTDEGLDSVAPGPSLHESVRQRMAGDDPRRTRRRPPRRAPDMPADRDHRAGRESDPGPAEQRQPSPAEPGKRVLSPEEVDALLADDEDNENNQRPAENRDAGEMP
jgi:hypothetical protein